MTSIITGDIINSRKANNQEWLDDLKEIFNNLYAAEIYRGDSFQVEIPTVKEALFTAIKIKSYIKKHKEIDVRMAIGIGKKGFSADTVGESNGEAFVNSGKAFDNLKKQNLLIKSPWKEFDEEINIAVGLALLVMDNWTPNSAEFVKASLNNLTATQKEVAELLNISQSSASERRKRAGLEEILKLEKRYRKLITQKLTT
ncbi:MAG: transcriptional regulator [Flavobacteriaceae bacterium]|nr:transcriptional regulator [Flavobacteriaceae bacterium]